MKITILTDNLSSWYIKYALQLNQRFEELGHSSVFIQDKDEMEIGDVCFLLSCSKILPDNYLVYHKHNIVIHASDLPEGKGFSPLQWQILEGKDCIILTLFDAVKELDAGDFYTKEELCFEGHELLDELQGKMGVKINQMAERFIKNYSDLSPSKQSGDSTYYKKRTVKDDEIDPYKSIVEHFNHFRIANNNNYPLYFKYKGFKYNIKIEKRND
jgi:methionyl-tRNA formyltransferase